VTGRTGSFVRVAAETACHQVSWYSVNPELNLFPTELLRDSKTAVVCADVPGTYTLLAVTAAGDQVSAFASCTVVVTGAIPPGPGPGPNPPGPGPTPPTPPPSPAPIPAPGLRVLLIYKADQLTKLPPGQQEIFFGAAVRGYLASACTLGPDSKTREFRCWSETTDVSGESKLWQDAMKRPRASSPWILISNGTAGYEGPLPATADEALALVKKFAG
jgi:hypothetical protein